MEENLQIEKKSEIQVIADNINSGLKAFEDRKEELTQLRDKVAGLTIESIEDKAAIAEVATARKTLKKARVEIQKEGKSMRDPLTKIGKSILEKEYELIDIISPTEKDLQAKEDWVKEQQEKIDQADAAKKQELIQARIDKLAAYGFAIDITFLTGINDEQFEKVLDNARGEYEKEQAAKAEADRLEQERQAQIEKDLADLKALRERQAEADRIIKERQGELDSQAAALKKQQEEVEAEEARIRKGKRDAKINGRIQQMTDAGLVYDFSDDHYKGFGCFVPILDIKCHDDEKWERLIEEMNGAISFAKAKKEKEAEDKRLKDIEDARIKAIEDERERQRVAEAAKAEEKRLADLKKEQDLAIAGDKTKYQNTLDYILKTPVHEMRSSQYRAKMKVIRDFLDGLK